VALRADRNRGRPDELADEQHRGLHRAPRHSGAASATHNTFRQVGGTLGVAALGTIVAAGHHATGGVIAAFPAGLSHAMTAMAAILALCAVTVAVLGKKRQSLGRPAVR
jgi:MFS transporter, DHA2 family, methylenomycin A resistance protein